MRALISYQPILKRAAKYFWLPLLFLSIVWAGGTFLRRKLKPKGYRSKFFTVCIGGLHAGGMGKTPIVAHLVRELRPWSPVILSRGYRGKKSRQGAWVDPASHQAWKEYGDEPVFLAKTTGCPVRIGANRKKSAREAETKFNTAILVMDDGFQNLDLIKDINVVVLPEESLWQEQYCHPLGEMRESASALSEATAAVIVPRVSKGQGPVFRWKSFLAERFPALPVFEARPVWGGLYDGDKAYALKGGEQFGAFCGIAHPERFFHVLNQKLHSGSLVYGRTFSDHHIFNKAEWQKLQLEEQKLGITHWITTEKDRVRYSEGALTKPLLTARVDYDIAEGLVDLIQKRLERA